MEAAVSSEETRDDAYTRALVSLEGLSCGDAFGECFFFAADTARALAERQLQPAPWPFTDDTMMALSLVHILRLHGTIIEDELAAHFASLFSPFRGYGPAMHDLLARYKLEGGGCWRIAAPALFCGRASFGNGAAMRVAPLGAFFADDLSRVVDEAARSAIVTHAHPEGIAGAIAVAAAAAIAWRTRNEPAPAQAEFLDAVRQRVPASEVRNGIDSALRLGLTVDARRAGGLLGSGGRVSCMDTVPFVLWSAGRFLENYEEALWQTVSARGDMDTTCAMVGSIVAMRDGLAGIPAEWRARRERLDPFLSG